MVRKLGARVRRREDWPERLAEWVAGALRKPFAWGRHDCALAAADCVLAMTGEDLAAEYRGRYEDRAGALRALAEIAGGGVEEAAQKALGPALANPLMAQRGDVAMVETAEGPALGICLGREIAVAGPDGLAMVEITAARKAWRV